MTNDFHIIAKPAGSLCNLDCRYCFYLEKENLYPNSDHKMNNDILELFIKQRIEISNSNTVRFTWQGGEPTLLGLNYFRNIIALQRKYANGKQIDNSIQTNGVLINDEWCEFFKQNNILVGISIDGPEELHDKFRLDKRGKPTFYKVLNAIQLMKKHRVEFNTLTVINNFNSLYPLEIFNFLKENGSGFIQFIPIVERRADDYSLLSPSYKGAYELTDWSVTPENYGNFLIEIFDEWIRKDVGKYFVQIFDVALESWIGKSSSLCLFKETCGDALALEHNGDLYSCDHFVYPENRLGNIKHNTLFDLINSIKQQKFGKNKKEALPQLCLDCQFYFACKGECPKNRFVQTPEGKEGLNYLCAGYKNFFKHIDPYMKFMANELKYNRPPSNVMNWVKEKDLGFPNSNVGRNELCPCGSGKKLKMCCMNWERN